MATKLTYTVPEAAELLGISRSSAYECVRRGDNSLSVLKQKIERECIAHALAETSGNITRAAALLGMKRPRLSQLVKQHGLAALGTDE